MAALLAWLTREPPATVAAARADGGSRPSAPAIWAAGLVALFLATDLTLVIETFRFYGMR